MRGRTNVTQRSGAAQVNGDVKNLAVKTGNTISIGDFVSVEYGPSSSYLTSGAAALDTQNRQVFNISDDKLIFFYSNYAEVYNTNNGIVLETKFVGTWTSLYGSPSYAVCKISNNKFAIISSLSMIKYSDSGVKIDFITFNFEEKSFEVETKSYVNSNVSYISDYINSVQYLNGKIIVASGQYSTSKFRWLLLFDVESTTVDYFQTSYKGSGIISIVIADGGDFYLFCGSNEATIQIEKYNISTTTLLKGTFTFSDNSNRFYSTYCCYLGNNMFAIASIIYIDIISINDGTVTILNSFKINTNYIASYFVYSGNLIVFEVSSTSNIVLWYHVIPIKNIESYTLDSGFKFDLVSIVGYYTYWYINFNIVTNGFVLLSMKYNTSNLANAILCVLKDGIIAGYDSESFVTSYNGKALGFAKTGGSAGQTIEVYVPYES